MSGAGPFAILRVERMANAGVLAASAAHMARAMPTPNADAGRSHLNEVLIGTADPAADVRRRRDEVHLRANSGWGVEILLTASPGWWRRASDEQRRDWQASTTRWLEAEFGRENIPHLRWHHDETSPHLTGYVIPTKPRDAERGGPSQSYSAEAKFGGAAKLAALQDRYAEAVAHLGLERGVRNSAADHTTISDYYKALRGTDTPTPPSVPMPPVSITNSARERWAEEQSERIAEATRDLSVRARDAGVARKRAGEMTVTAKRAEAERDAARGTAARLSDQVRDIPLAEVLDRWKLQRDPADRNQWRAPPDEGGAGALRVTTKGAKWHDHAAGRGGGGAIDLVAHLGRMQPRDAIGWLAREFGVSSTARAVAARTVRHAEVVAKEAAAGPAPELPLPPEREPTPQNWARARRYLVERRNLPAALVDAEHGAGRIWADQRGSLVWPLTDEDGRRVGFEWRAARDKREGEERAPRGVVPGSRTAAGAYDLPAADSASRDVLVVEGAPDALAARALGFQGRILGVAGTNNGRGLLRALADRLAGAVRWVLGYDADRPGDAAAAEVAEMLPGAERKRPREVDWSAMLLRRRTQRPSTPGPNATAATPRPRP
mgnify:CR=1 FL=1